MLAVIKNGEEQYISYILAISNNNTLALSILKRFLQLFPNLFTAFIDISFIVNRYATKESRCFFYFITNSIKLPLILQIRNDADNVSTTYAISHYIFEIFTPFSFNLYSNFTPF